MILANDRFNHFFCMLHVVHFTSALINSVTWICCIVLKLVDLNSIWMFNILRENENLKSCYQTHILSKQTKNSLETQYTTYLGGTNWHLRGSPGSQTPQIFHCLPSFNGLHFTQCNTGRRERKNSQQITTSACMWKEPQRCVLALTTGRAH